MSILKRKLELFIEVVIEEASRNAEFEAKLVQCLEDGGRRSPAARRSTELEASVQNAAPQADAPSELQKEQGDSTGGTRAKNRRAKAVLEPVSLVRDGEQVLRAELEKLDLEQLRDIVAEYGMDSGRLVMKWVKTARVIDRIVEIASTRANKGHAFRRQDD